MNIQDPSFLFLLLGKDSTWIPLLMACIFLFKQWDSVQACWKSWSPFRKPSMHLSAKIYTKKEDDYVYGTIPAELWGIILDTKEKLCKHPVSSVMSIRIPANALIASETVSIPIGEPFCLTESIYVTFKISRKTAEITEDYESSKKNRVELDECTIEMTLVGNTLQDIMTYTRNHAALYTADMKKANEQKPRIIKPNVCSSGGYPHTIPFNSYKTFDNMFFDGKEDLLHRLMMFRDCDVYKRLGLPHTLGLLFYGEPGTGKTSVIKAIANYMNMSLILVPMNLIKTRKQLERVFHSYEMEQVVPYNKRIYVFEEIDCNGWDKLVKNRLGKVETENPPGNEFVTVVEDEKIKIVKKDKQEDDLLTLGAILEIIDGIVETPGRIIIMTTNHRTVLDPALTRPGRIDMEIEFKKLRAEHVACIYEKWYGHVMPEKDQINIPDNHYTQADISQLLFKYECDPQGFIMAII